MNFSEYQEKARRTQNDALTINMKTAMLEYLLRKAAALSIQPVSVADLP